MGRRGNWWLERWVRRALQDLPVLLVLAVVLLARLVLPDLVGVLRVLLEPWVPVVQQVSMARRVLPVLRDPQVLPVLWLGLPAPRVLPVLVVGLLARLVLWGLLVLPVLGVSSTSATSRRG